MTGYDVQLWEKIKVKSKDNGLDVRVVGDKFEICSAKRSYGKSDTILEVWQFICGYDWGKSEKI